MTRTGLRLVLILLLIIDHAYLQAQDNPDLWMLEEIATDTSIQGEISNYSFYHRGPIFWPAEFGSTSRNLQSITYDLIVKTKDGLFVLIDGTGRVYKVVIEKKGDVRMVRIDSTVVTGYNNNAAFFTHQDSIFSLGGYGIWSHNGQLRYFKASKHTWEIMPVNELVQAEQHNSNYWDPVGHCYYFITLKSRFQGLKPNSAPFMTSTDANHIKRLNMITKDWEDLGVVNSNFNLNIIPAGILPFGKLFITGPITYNTYAVDFAGNRILQLKNLTKATQLFDAIFTVSGHEKPCRVFTYYKDSALVILTSAHDRIVIPLSRADFKDTGLLIYDVKTNPDLGFSVRAFLLGVPIALLFVGIGVLAWKKRPFAPKRPMPAVMAFDKIEIHIISSFISNEDHVLSVEALDKILDSGKKSRDVQNQRRSSAIRSINTKYTFLTSDHKPLITTSRLDADRRMMRYVMDQSKFRRIEEKFIAQRDKA